MTEKETKSLKIDDSELMSTTFDEPITSGKIQLSVGKATTDSLFKLASLGRLVS